MASRQRNLVGQKFGKLTVLEMRGRVNGNHNCSLVRCDCGNEYVIGDTYLVTGRIKGCIKCINITHGGSKTRLHTIWTDMKSRCDNPNNIEYSSYGGRGITYCNQWKEFSKFQKWAIENGYSEDLSIDRIDNDGNYEPSNCRWADRFTQANNKRNNRIYEYKGQKKTIGELSREYKIDYFTLRKRLDRGWSVERSVNEEAIVGKNQFGISRKALDKHLMKEGV